MTSNRSKHAEPVENLSPKRRFSRLPLCLAPLLLLAMTGSSQVIINEIMYHPSSENVLEEYIELHNRAGTNVNVGGWRFSNGVEFTIPLNTTIPPNGFLVVAAHRQTFTNKYPGVVNVVGNWVGILSNTRNDIDLDDASGNRVDSVEYADEGDWAVRQRGPLDRGFRGWVWYKEHDGLGKSLELVNPALPNEHGQNWAPSILVNGTPGAINSVLDSNIAPMILQVRHFPVVPGPSDTVTITARLLDEFTAGLTATLRWRVDGAGSFGTTTMFDDGAHGDGAAGDGLWGAMIPPQPNNTVVEFYLEASDGQNNSRTWPAPALNESGTPGQFANALYQVDDNLANTFGGTPVLQPVYKMILTEVERVELASIPSQSSQQGPNSQMNATFISLDVSGPSLHYLVGVRNRGHASRTANPPNYRVNFRSDDRWQGVTAINLNSREVHIQHLGSILANRAGSAGNYSRAAQVRVNNQNRATPGAPMFGSYAANEVYNNEWAERHLPNDSGGNIYKAVRDIKPPDFDYRTLAAYPSGTYSGFNFVNHGPEDKRTYTNSFYKETNVSEDDWTDLFRMLRVMGVNGTDDFTEGAVRQVINVEQWLTHLAVMAIMGNAESGLNDGHNDDYYMYRGINDPRFILMPHDLDQILGINSRGTTDGVFGCMNYPPRGSVDTGGVGLMMQRFLSTNYVFRTQYLQTIQHLLNTTFSAAQFDPLVDQTLSSYVPSATVNSLKTWMAQRRTHLQNNVLGTAFAAPGIATITGEPRSPTPLRTATLTIGGNDIVSYRFRLNNGSYGAERPVSQQIVFPSLANGTTNTVYVIGKTSAGGWQSTANPTASRTWVINTSWPGVRFNEVLAQNNTAVNHNGTFPDVIELYNEGTATVDLSGMRLTDDPSEPNKYTFPPGTSLGVGQYLVLYGNEIGISLDAQGEGVYLYNAISSGGALMDSVEFGIQLPDYSIGRINGSSGSWYLCQPTAGATNVGVATVSPYAVRINEWLAAPQSPFGDDFIELINPTAAPVDIGGLFLTDTPIGAPTRHRIPDLTFIPPGGYFVFTADGDVDPGHVNFQLSSDLGEIALIGPGRTTIDCVYYGPQRPGISMGRCPDAASGIAFLVLPTPGSPNACAGPVVRPTVNLLQFTNVWRYADGGTNLGTAWKDVGYNDSWWPSGPGLLGLDNDPQPEPILTSFTSPISGKLAFYFRTRFVVPPGLEPSQLVVTHLVDDGAIFYLNGQEVGPRFNMPPGTVDYLTAASTAVGFSTSYQEFQFVPMNLQPGTNLLAVEVHQAAPNSPDIVFGLKLDALIVTNNPEGLVINEVLANNGTLAEADGSTPDWVEFYNPSDLPVNLAGMSLSDSTLNPDRYVFPNGSIVPARGYFAIRCDADRPPSATNSGFGLKASGDSLYLFNPNNTVFTFVTFGIQAADFSIGRVGGNWILCVPSIGAANIPTALGNVMLLRINEWMANPAPGDDDYIEIYNPNPQPVALGGCYLTDDLSDRLKYSPIAALSFIGAGTNAWQKFIADDNAGAGADHLPFGLRAAGEEIGLSAPNGTPIDSIPNFGAQTSGVSQGRLLDGEATIVSFPGTPSPGDPNYVLMNNVVISEVLTHTDLPFEDAIEIQNVGATPVNIAGWWLSDSRGAPRKYQIPLNTAPIAPGGFKVFYEFQFNDRDAAPIPFALSSANGDEVYLSAVTNLNLTGARAQAEFGAAENGVSFGRHRTSQGFDFTALSRRTFGQDNALSVEQFRSGTGLSNAYPKVGPIVISELMYHPVEIGTNDNVVEEFVELHNLTNVAVNLFDPANPTNRWRLRSGVDFDFPPGLSIAPGGYLLVVSFDPANNAPALATFRAKYGTNSVLVGPYSGKLDNGGEGVRLLKPDSPQLDGGVPYVLVDYISYSDRAPWPTNADGFGSSLQRIHVRGYGNDPTNWVAAAPTPGPSGVLDSDNDGMPNSWEMLYMFNPNSAIDAGQDADGDGMTNLQEYQAGTNPRVAGSRLRVESITSSGNTVTLQFNAASNKTYTVQYRTSLATGSWVLLNSVPASGTNVTRTITDSGAGSSAQRYYRVLTP